MNQRTLYETVERRAATAYPEQLDTLIDALRYKHGPAINAVLFYGSCLRSGDIHDGLVDLYLIVDNYDTFYRNKRLAIANGLLAPNVFYTEVEADTGVIRCKYAVVSRRDFLRGTQRWFHAYLWGRFTQPIALVYARDERSRRTVFNGLSHAVTTFLTKVLPALPETGTVRDLWIQGLQLSYQTELRTEQKHRAASLVDHELDYYMDITRAARPLLPFEMRLEDATPVSRYRSVIPDRLRRLSHLTWPARKLLGKLLSVLRLLKALFTFEGGLDYIAWKLERHSGQKIEIPDRVRRYPLLFIWGLFWRLYRRGIFR